jgi:hypothetical protein
MKWLTSGKCEMSTWTQGRRPITLYMRATIGDSNQRVIALQIIDPSSCQRGRPAWRRKKTIVTQRNVKSGHELQRGPGTKTNCPADRRSQYNSNSNWSAVWSSCRTGLHGSDRHSAAFCHSDRCLCDQGSKYSSETFGQKVNTQRWSYHRFITSALFNYNRMVRSWKMRWTRHVTRTGWSDVHIGCWWENQR